MIWLKIEEVENKIAKDELTEKEGFHYYLATVIYGILYLFYLSLIILAYKIALPALYYFVLLLITILGVAKVFQINNKIDDKDFLKRYFAVTWVIRIKLLIASLVFFFICMNFFDLRKVSTTKSIIYLVFEILMEILFYALIIKSFNRIKTKRLYNGGE